jgi:hypothetical protein
MLPAHLSSEVEVVRIMNAVAAGTSDQTSSAVDMVGYDSVMFVALLGTLTATQATSMKIQQSSDDGSSDSYGDLTGTDSGNMADDDDNQMIIIDVHKPSKRYLKAILLRETANAVIDGIIAIKYNARSVPITQGSTVFNTERFLSPAEGTA